MVLPMYVISVIPGSAHLCRGHWKSPTGYLKLSSVSHTAVKCTFHFGGRHLGFLADVDVRRYRKFHHWKAWHRKYGERRWNFIAMCTRIRDMPGGGGGYSPVAGERRKKTVAGTRVKTELGVIQDHWNGTIRISRASDSVIILQHCARYMSMNYYFLP